MTHDQRTQREKRMEAHEVLMSRRRDARHGDWTVWLTDDEMRIIEAALAPAPSEEVVQDVAAANAAMAEHGKVTLEELKDSLGDEKLRSGIQPGNTGERRSREFDSPLVPAPPPPSAPAADRLGGTWVNGIWLNTPKPPTPSPASPPAKPMVKTGDCDICGEVFTNGPVAGCEHDVAWATSPSPPCEAVCAHPDGTGHDWPHKFPTTVALEPETPASEVTSPSRESAAMAASLFHFAGDPKWGKHIPSERDVALLLDSALSYLRRDRDETLSALFGGPHSKHCPAKHDASGAEIKCLACLRAASEAALEAERQRADSAVEAAWDTVHVSAKRREAAEAEVSSLRQELDRLQERLYDANNYIQHPDPREP